MDGFSGPARAIPSCCAKVTSPGSARCATRGCRPRCATRFASSSSANTGRSISSSAVRRGVMTSAPSGRGCRSRGCAMSQPKDWTLYYLRHTGRRERYPLLGPTRRVDELLVELADDPICLFWELTGRQAGADLEQADGLPHIRWTRLLPERDRDRMYVAATPGRILDRRASLADRAPCVSGLKGRCSSRPRRRRS